MIDLDAVSPRNLTAFNRDIAQWTRLSGTPDERAAAAYAEGQLKSFGYATRILTHDAYISLPGRAALRVTRPTATDIPCITHSMGICTPPEGLSGQLVYVGWGTPAEYAGAAGKVALVEGRATPQHAVTATQAGVRALICISGRHPHEMCCSPVWGNPSQQTQGALPAVVLLSVNAEDGRALRDLCRQGRVDVDLAAAVDTKWTKTPIVLGDLTPGHPRAERGFVLFSGHLDSWYVGAMDNGSANAAMLEVARLLALHQGTLRRGLRVAMWSGHSHGRYSSSAWYADNFWFDLAEHCLLHVNVDSLGGIDADHFSTNSMPQTVRIAADAVALIAGETLEGKRVGRNSDQSFLGIGIPTILGSVSHQPDGSLGWWWHTPHDTLDKIDPTRLLRDAKIFVRVLERFLTDPVLPLDYRAAATDLRSSLEALATEAGRALDLSPAISAASTLEELCGRLAAASADVTPARAGAINACLHALGRSLIPAAYTTAGPYAHDPALETPFLPRLAPARRLGTLPADGDDARFLLVDLVRARNTVTDALLRACRHVETCLGRLG